MTQVDEATLAVMAAAQRWVKTGDAEFNKIDLETLKKADYQLDDRDIDSGWRRAIRDRIQELKERPEILELKPELYGIKLNLNECLRRIRALLRR